MHPSAGLLRICSVCRTARALFRSWPTPRVPPSSLCQLAPVVDPLQRTQQSVHTVAEQVQRRQRPLVSAASGVRPPTTALPRHERPSRCGAHPAPAVIQLAAALAVCRLYAAVSRGNERGAAPVKSGPAHSFSGGQLCQPPVGACATGWPPRRCRPRPAAWPAGKHDAPPANIGGEDGTHPWSCGRAPRAGAANSAAATQSP